MVLHVAAVLFYLFKKRQNLILPMLLGDKHLPSTTPASTDGLPQRLLALLLVMICAAGAVWVASLAP